MIIQDDIDLPYIVLSIDKYHTFCKEITQVDATNIVMASFDVKSLFTQIPLNENIDICVNESFKQLDNSNENALDLLTCSYLDKNSYFTKNDFKKLLELATLDMHFLFNGTLYKQVDGVAMGSPLGPTLANTFMCYWEEKWLENCPHDFKPLLYRRYVDDTFLIFNSPDHVALFLNFLNSRHINIEFTCDLENNKSLPFLDLHVKRQESCFTTTIYRKATFTGLLSKFESFTPLKYKENLIATLIHRAYKLCSSFSNFDVEVNFLKSILAKNGYPLYLIEKQIKKVLNKLYTPFGEEKPSIQTVPKAIVYFPTYFLGPASSTVSSKLTQLLGEFYPQVSLRIVYTDGNTLGNHFSFKDKIPKHCLSNVIYKYTCGFCQEFYIGMTCRQFRSRIREHCGLTVRTGKPCAEGSETFSEIRNHCNKEHQKHVDPDRFEIIARLRHKGDLETLESLYQRSLKPKIINQQQSVPLLSYSN